MGARRLLTDLKIQRARPDDAKPYRIADGGNLYLYVPPSGVSAWQFIYRHDGKRQTATLGKLADMSLKEARDAAEHARKQVAKGMHLTVAKRVERATTAATVATTFGVVSKRWIARAARKSEWTPHYKRQVEQSIDGNLADLMALPVSTINAKLVAPILEAIDRRAPDVATKVSARLNSIMDYAVREGLIERNPLPRSERKKRERRHYPAVTERAAIGEILRRADKIEAFRGVRRAHWLLVLTAQRVGEIVGSRWDEFDLEAATWTIPRERMKMKDSSRGPHVVPLSPRLLVMLRDWKSADGDAAVHVTPSPTGEASIVREAVEKFYNRGLALAGQHSPHSWRSVLSTWARDAGKDADAVEAQLDHIVGNKVEAAYDRAKRLTIRRALMTWYENAILSARDGAPVVSLKGRRA